MALNWGGSAYFGDQNPSTNYWTYTQPTFRSAAAGVGTLFWLHGIYHAIGGAAPQSASSEFQSIWSNVTTEVLGNGGNDCYLGHRAANYSVAADRLKPIVKLSKLSISVGATSQMLGTIPYTRGFYCTALVMDGTNVILKTCKFGGTTDTQLSQLLNGTFTGTDRSIGTMRAAFGHFRDGIQAFGWADGYAFTDSDVQDAVNGRDIEAIVSSSFRTHLLQFTTNGNINASWGTNNATLVGSLTAQQVGSPIVPTIGSTFLSCDEPAPLKCVGLRFGQTTAPLTLTGTYNGFTPSAAEYQAIDGSGTVLQAWTALGSFSAATGTWTGIATLPSGYGRILQLRDGSDHSKTWNGTHPINVGIAYADSGQSQTQRQQTLLPGITASPSINVAFLTLNQSSGTVVTLANTVIGPENFRPTNAGFGAGWNETANAFGSATGNLVPMTFIPGAVPGTNSAQWAASFSFPWTSTSTTFTTSGANDTLTLPSSGNPCDTDTTYNNCITFITISGTKYPVTYDAATRNCTFTGHIGVLTGTVTFTASGAQALNTNNNVELGPNLIQSIRFSGTNHVHVRWMQGTADAGATSTQRKTHMTSRFNSIDAALTALGITFDFIMDPQCRDTGNQVMAVNLIDRDWTTAHAEYGTRVFLGIGWHDMSTNGEYQVVATSFTTTTLTFPLNTFSDQNTFTNLEVITPGFEQTKTGTNSGGVFTIAAAGTFSPALSGTITVRLSTNTPHQDYYGAQLPGIRTGQDFAYKQGLATLNPQGADLIKATYPHGGDGSIIDRYYAPAPGGAWGLRTPNGSTAPATITGLENTENNFAGTLTQTSQQLVSPMHVRTVGTAPGTKANLRVRDWRVDGYPFTFAHFAQKDDALYDGNGLTAKGGSPVNPTFDPATANGYLAVTEAPPLAANQSAARLGARGNAPRRGVKH